MAKQKHDKSGRKPRRIVALPESLAAQLEKAGEATLMNLTDVVKAACIDYLTRLGAWPPRAKS